MIFCVDCVCVRVIGLQYGGSGRSLLFARFLSLFPNGKLLSGLSGSTRTFDLRRNFVCEFLTDRNAQFLFKFHRKRKKTSAFSFDQNKNENWHNDTLSTKVNLVH